MSIINTKRRYPSQASRKELHYETCCGDMIKIIWHDGLGMSIYAKRLERGRFIWPSASDGLISISLAQMSYMLEGIDWRNPQYSFRPLAAG